MEIRGLMGVWRCKKCPTIILEPISVIRDDRKSITISKPAECFKEQEGCGRSINSTDFELVDVLSSVAPHEKEAN